MQHSASLFRTFSAIAMGVLLAMASHSSAAVANGEAQASTFKVGAVRIDITPADLSGLNPMTGKAFDKVHDPIFARLVLLSLGKQAALFVSIDAIEVGNLDQDRMRIAHETGIRPDHIMITATHDHNAPRLGNVTPGALAHPGGSEVTAYTRAVVDKLIAGIRTARDSARAARYGVGVGSADININRDAYTPAGWKIGVNPDGPSDKSVHVVRFDDLQGRTIAAIINYPVHANVMLGANQLSGDLTEVATSYAEEGLGGDVVVAFAQSAIGDQAPRLFNGGPKSTDEAIAASWRQADAQGVMLGGEVLRVLRQIDSLQPAQRLSAGEQILKCPVKRGVDVMADMRQEQVDEIPIHLSMIRFDDVALGGVSGEVLTNIGRRLQARSPLKNMLLISLTNDRVGYLPEDAAYDRPIFEVKGSPVARGCAEDGIVNGLINLVQNGSSHAAP